jgi:hypothetical protein
MEKKEVKLNEKPKILFEDKLIEKATKEEANKFNEAMKMILSSDSPDSEDLND